MKKIIVINALVGMFFLSACEKDWLDIEPTTQVQTDKAITTAKDVEYALNGIYSAMQSSSYYGAQMTYYGDVTGEDMQARSATKRCAKYYLFEATKDKSFSDLWSSPYYVIRLSNNILNAIDKVNFADELDKNDFRGQALTLRALALFDLTRVFGIPYTKDNGESLGAAIITKPMDVSYKPTRNTVAECYTQIIKDLTDAVPLLKTEKTQGRVNRFAAMALLARAYLYKNDNTNALLTAENLIAESKTAGYRLWTNAEYVAAWRQSFTSEVFFEIVNTKTDGSGKESVGYLHWRSGYDDIILSADFWNLIRKDAADVRLSIINNYSSTRKYLLKYVGNTATDATEDPRDANIPIFRLSEVYLIAAEAAVKEGDDTKASKYLNDIRLRANPALTPVSGITHDQVLDERRKELVGEGHRMFDAIRNNRTINRAGSTHLSALTSETKSFNWDYYKIVLPIPKKEMDANTNMVQNPVY